MEEGISVKANLIIAMQTSNAVSFELIIKTTEVPLYNLKDSHGCNIFHDIASSVVKEDTLLKILNVMVAEFIDRYFDDSDDIIRSMLNDRKDKDGHTPLLDAVIYNKRVKVI
jgi:ankyrin repeat protein